MMFNLKPLIPALLATSFLPATMAETCSAIGSLSDNSVVGLGPQGLSSNVILQNGNGDKIGELEVCDTCPHACTDLAYIEGEGLEDSFAWAASCSINHFK
ncbi:hypothetical protein N7533_009552 [Penicillium manginii]|jgi:hypothetical protein|uniref:uncharacterized protein n=1 Tax=Penicillium manginii TaxID=203109 RepID=UPI00254683E5|nr:uncharacterized protein N7533_009552 [Penicillium manginii]KAJ5744682.1 hypothetical protein N7533_009552 [Penicillium manginii]